MYTVYVLKSLSKNFTYTGFTNNLKRRLSDHNSGYNKSTKPYLPFEVIYTETVSSGAEARKREKFLKSGRGRKFIQEILDKTRAGSP